MSTSTQTKKTANGKYYQVSTSFKIGNKVAIHNMLTGCVAYIGTIEFLGKNCGQISLPNGGNHIINSLKSALVIN